MKLQPRNEHVIVRKQEKREQTRIVVIGQEHEQDMAVVVAVGPGGLTVDGKRMPIEVTAGIPLKEGHVVFLRGGEYESFDDEGVRHMIVPQSSIIAVEKDGTH